MPLQSPNFVEKCINNASSDARKVQEASGTKEEDSGRQEQHKRKGKQAKAENTQNGPEVPKSIK